MRWRCGLGLLVPTNGGQPAAAQLTDWQLPAPSMYIAAPLWSAQAVHTVGAFPLHDLQYLLKLPPATHYKDKDRGAMSTPA